MTLETGNKAPDFTLKTKTADGSRQYVSFLHVLTIRRLPLKEVGSSAASVPALALKVERVAVS